MKKFFGLCFAVLLPFLLLAAPGAAKRIFITWDDLPEYSEDTNIVFYIYTQTNATMPLAGWTVWSNVNVLQWVAAERKIEIPMASTTQAFYVVTASNVFGESDFSAAVSTRRLGPAKTPKIGQF